MTAENLKPRPPSSARAGWKLAERGAGAEGRPEPTPQSAPISVASAAAEEPQYRCPGESYAISRAVHLGRLARFYPGCRECPHRDDTGTLSVRQVEQLSAVRSRGPAPPLFMAEGVQGVYPNVLAPTKVRTISAALGMYLLARRTDPAEPPVVLVGGDGRAMTAELVAMASEGLRWAGCHIVEVGAVSAPCLAFTIDHLQASAGMLVGNPCDRPQMAGLKFWSGGAHPLSTGAGLEQIEAIAAAPIDRPTRTFGTPRRFSAEEPYLAALAEHYHALRPLRLILDTACLPVAAFLRKLLAPVACQALTGPLAPGELPGRVLAEKAHFGFYVGDDGEVCRLVDERGRPVPAERLLLLLARHRLAACPGGTIVVEPETAPLVTRTIGDWGGRAIESPACRAAMEQTIRHTGALLAGGPSGRIWHAVGLATPDALQILSTLLVLLSRSDRRLSEVLDAEAPAS